jgi:KDO2-lipid IV(A) lauroyltransferase
MTSLFRFLSILPLWLLHAVGWALGWVVFLSSGVYRRRFLANVRQAGYGWPQWRTAVGQAGCLVAELPRIWMGRPARIQWKGAQHVAQALAQGRGVLLLSPHLGCFEVIGQAYGERFGHLQPMTALYRPSRQASLRAVMEEGRNRPGVLTAPTTMAGVRQLIKALRSGQTVGLLPDQVPPMGLGVWAPFFGQPAYTMTLSARLAQQTGAVMLLIWGERLSWGRGYRVHVKPLQEALPLDAEQAASCINRAMEQLIAQCPQQYLWGYARYKQPRQEGI